MTQPEQKFIVIDGIDWSDIMTQVDILSTRFKTRKVPLCRAPDLISGSIGRIITANYAREEDINTPIGEHMAAYLHAIAALERRISDFGILNTLSNGKSVLCARDILSSLVWDTYRHFGKDDYDVVFQDVLNHNRYSLGLATPDLTIFIDRTIDDVYNSYPFFYNRIGFSELPRYDDIVLLREHYLRMIDYMRTNLNHRIEIITGGGANIDISYKILEVVKPLYPEVQ